MNNAITPVKTGDIVTDFCTQETEKELNHLSNLWHQNKTVDNNLNMS